MQVQTCSAKAFHLRDPVGAVVGKTQKTDQFGLADAFLFLFLPPRRNGNCQMHHALQLLDIVQVICKHVAGQSILHDSEICLRRPIASTDWGRPLFYMHRVRSLTLNTSFESSDIFEALSLSLPGDYLFPNLEELMWSPKSTAQSIFHHIRLFLSPYVRTLSLGNIETVTDLSILSNLASKRPSLKHFTIYHDFPSTVDPNNPPIPWDKATPIISRFVEGSKHLETLSVPSVDDVALAHLAQLPSLTALSIQSHPPLAFSFQPPADSVLFPVLQRLTASTKIAATSLITRLSGRSLTDLTIHSNWIHPTKEVARLFYSALATHCSPSSLEEINISRNRHNPLTLDANQAHEYSVGGDTIEPLLSFVNLTSVYLSHPVGFDLDDTMVLHMARAWPCITSLTLLACPSRHISSRVTLRGLYTFAKHCPDLLVLEMTFDATKVPKIRINGKKKKSQWSLFHLNVALSPFRKPRLVANFLCAIFPELVEIGTSYDEILDHEDEDEEDEQEVVIEPEVIASHNMWKQVQEELCSEQVFGCL